MGRMYIGPRDRLEEPNKDLNNPQPLLVAEPLVSDSNIVQPQELSHIESAPKEIFVDRYIDKIQYIDREVIKEVEVIKEIIVPKIEYIEKEVVKEVEVFVDKIQVVEKEVIKEVDKIIQSKLAWILLSIETLVLIGLLLK